MLNNKTPPSSSTSVKPTLVQREILELSPPRKINLSVSNIGKAVIGFTLIFKVQFKFTIAIAS
ncbi:MAG: hypothetical protein H7061_11375 [Bdellovibrionaceae bacterium]|nr:hypothetical protein [Bdellovibrio sp.]